MNASPLPDDFQFSQGNLQDFADCPKRFLLRHIERRAYPAAEAEPIRVNELRKERGVRFHEMICQDHSGVPRRAIDAQCQGDDALQTWWANYKRHAPVAPGPETRAEITVRGRIDGYPLVATYDLVACRPDGTLEIYDWKTSSRRPGRDRLAARLQTKAYPYLLVEAGAWLNGGKPIDPGQVQMTYWFSQHPGDPETFDYTAFQYQTDGEALAGYVQAIEAREARTDFERTGDTDHCRYCTYRSYCGRGAEAGAVDGGEPYLEETASLEVNLDDLDEIEF
jgi:hypothetical protein